jgi:hypothetical protein
MKKITIVGAASPAKIVIRTALELSFEVLDLLPEELSINNIGTTDLVIYVAELVDEQVSERLRIGYKSLILVSIAESEVLDADFFVQSCDFQSSDIEKILEGTRSMKEFIDKSTWVELSQEHEKFLAVLREGELEGRSHKENMIRLGIGKTKYKGLQKELKMLLGAGKNYQIPYLTG